MSGVPRHPEALKYNVSKKLSQLNNVIMLLSAQREDRKFRKEYLSQLYDPQIMKVLNDFSDKIKEINTHVSSVYDEILAKTDKLYQAKAQTQITEFNSKVKAIEEQHMKVMDRLLVEHTQAQTTLDSLMQGMNKRDEALAKEIQSQKLRVSERINQSKENRDKEIQIVGKETLARENQLEKDFSLRKRALTESFEKQKRELHNESSKELGIEAKLAVYAKSLSPRIDALKNDSLKDQLNNLIRQMQTATADLKQQVLEFSDASARERDSMQQKMREKKDELNSCISTFKDEENVLARQKQNLVDANKKQLEKLNIDRMKMLDEMKAEIQRIKDRSNFASKQMDQIIEELKAKCNRDQEELNSRLSSEKSIQTDKLHECEKKIEAAANQNLKLIDEMKAQVRKSKEFHETEIASMSTKLNNLREESNASNSEEIVAVKNRMNQCKQASASQISQTKSELERINNEKAEIVKSHHHDLDEISEFEEKEITQLREQQTREIDALVANSTAELENLEKKNAASISERRQKNETDKENALVVFEYQRKQSIQEIEDQGFDPSEYNQLQEDYKAQLSTLQNELSVINPPSLDKDVFKSLNDEIEKLVTEKSQMEQSIENSRKSVIEEYELKQQQEEERHKAAIAPSGSGRGRKQVIQALNQNISTARTERETAVASLHSESDSLNSNHLEIMRKLGSERAALEDPTEIENLKESLEHENHCFMETAKVDESRQSEVDQLVRSNSRVECEFQQQIEHIGAETSSLISVFKSDLSLAENELHANQSMFRELVEQEILTFNKLLEKRHVTHSNDVREFRIRTAELTNSLSAVEAEFMKEMNRDFARGENAINDYQKRQRSELRKIEQDWEGILGFYDERIEVLTQKLSQMQEAVKNMPSRECDLEQIDRLQTTLRTVKMQLGNGLTDLKQYRAMLVDQDNQYSKMFGGIPKVGVMKTPR